MKARKYEDGIINEFDSIDELRVFDSSYITNTRSIILKEICSKLSCAEEDLKNFTRIKHFGDYLLFSFNRGEEVFIYDGRDSSIKSNS